MTLANNFRFTTLLMTSQPAAAKNSNTNLSFDFPSAHKKILFMMMMIIKPQIPIYVFFSPCSRDPSVDLMNYSAQVPWPANWSAFFLIYLFPLFVCRVCVPSGPNQPKEVSIWTLRLIQFFCDVPAGSKVPSLSECPTLSVNGRSSRRPTIFGGKMCSAWIFCLSVFVRMVSIFLLNEI